MLTKGIPMKPKRQREKLTEWQKEKLTELYIERWKNLFKQQIQAQKK